MEVFSSTIMQFGMLVKKNGEDLHESSKIINSKTDLDIFIETNKSMQPFVEKEKFEVFDENIHGRKKNTDQDLYNSMHSQSSDSAKNPYSG